MAAGVDEQQLAIARVYARSLLVLADGEGRAETVLEELGELTGLLDRRPEIEAFLASPLVDDKGRRQVLEKSLRGRLSDLLVDALQVMSGKGRGGLARALAAAYVKEYEARRGLIEVDVTTAVRLSGALREQVTQAARALSGKEVRLVEKVDARVVGGMVLKIGDRKVDATVATDISRLSRRLLARASQEIQGGREYFE